MRKSNIQSCTLLAIIGGCATELYVRLPNEHKSKALDAYNNTVAALKSWPLYGDNQNELVTKCRDNVEKWRAQLNTNDPFLFTVIIWVMSQCIAELQTIIKDSKKVTLLTEVETSIEALQEVVGYDYCVLKEAENRMRYLYDIIGWEW